MSVYNRIVTRFLDLDLVAFPCCLDDGQAFIEKFFLDQVGGDLVFDAGPDFTE